LVANQVNTKLPFLEKNQELVEQIKLEQEKLRRNDLLIEEQAFVALYQENIPEHIHDIYKLRRWLKKDWASRNQLLTFTPCQLRTNLISSVEDYPSDIFINGVMLPLSYRFAPGQAEDGIHVSIPVEMLSQFEDNDFEWLVPGYLKDKIVATLKNLPKTLRKQLIPIADTAELCVSYMMAINYTDRDFKDTLRESLLRTKAFKLSNDEIDTDKIPSHLKMKYIALKTDSNDALKAAFYHDLKSIKQRHANHQSAAVNNSNRRVAELESAINQKLEDWPRENFSIEESVKRGGQSVRLFNGLTDRQTHVCIEQYPSLAAAKSANNLGVCRLIQIDNRALIKSFKNSWPERRELEQLSLRYGGFSVLLDWIVCSNILQLINSSADEVEDRQTFAKIRDLSRAKLRARVAEDLNELLKCLQSTRSIYQNINRLQNDVYQASLSDITRQLGLLWSTECYMQKGKRVFTDYRRYLLGIGSRLSRIEENFPRESQLLDGWLEWVSWWQEFQSKDLSFEANKQHWVIFWLLEEYRLSLFTLNIKIEGKISATKLQKAFERLESLTST